MRSNIFFLCVCVCVSCLSSADRSFLSEGPRFIYSQAFQIDQRPFRMRDVCFGASIALNVQMQIHKCLNDQTDLEFCVWLPVNSIQLSD